MKGLIILILFIISSVNVLAQGSLKEIDKNQHQINIGYFNAFSLSTINNLGIGYKYTFKNKGALRVASSFSYSDDSREYQDRFYETSSYSLNPRLGYEFHMNFKKIIVFYGIDLVGSYYESIDKYDFKDPENSYRNTDRERKRYGLGVSPILGVQYQINRSISISTETSFNFMYWKETYVEKGGNEYYDSTNTSMTAKLSPLGIFSVNIHF